jgi:hypothetical protein
MDELKSLVASTLESKGILARIRVSGRPRAWPALSACGAPRSKAFVTSGSPTRHRAIMHFSRLLCIPVLLSGHTVLSTMLG